MYPFTHQLKNKDSPQHELCQSELLHGSSHSENKIKDETNSQLDKIDSSMTM